MAARVFVITGPSGVGKGTLIGELLDRVEGLELSTSATTRSPRGGEEDGRVYHFLSPEEFDERVAEVRPAVVGQVGEQRADLDLKGCDTPVALPRTQVAEEFNMPAHFHPSTLRRFAHSGLLARIGMRRRTADMVIGNGISSNSAKTGTKPVSSVGRE